MVVNSKIKKFGKAMVCLLLNLVISSTVFINSIHETIEHFHQSEELCSEELEKDACHRFLVHHQESVHCNKTHKHLEQKSDECFTCKYIKEQQSSIRSANSKCVDVFTPSISGFQSVPSSLVTSQLIQNFLRGPPVTAL